MLKKIIVPATSANLGCGFDSLGLAVSAYLEVEILEAADKWQIDHTFKNLPTDQSNLIIETALKLIPELPPHHLKMTSQIPLEHGLGSSSSAIVAGIKLALAISGRELSMAEQIDFACQIEGHPDNVVPALLGGLQVGSYDETSGGCHFISLPVPDCKLLAFVPDYSLSTRTARSVLPDYYSRSQAALASSKANVLVASLAQGQLKKAGQMMETDRFHENYRSALVPELAEIRQLGQAHQAYATYLSGAGSTIMTWISANDLPAFETALQAYQKTHAGQLLLLEVDSSGAKICEK
ncbi:MAG: homoserine kinase [Lactococcus sp.]